MSTVITLGATVLILAFLGMFLLSRWRLRTIGLVLAGVATVYVGVVFWFAGALDAALKSAQDTRSVSTLPTNGTGGLKTNAP